MAGLHVPDPHCIRVISWLSSLPVNSCYVLQVGEGWDPSLAPVGKRGIVLGGEGN